MPCEEKYHKKSSKCYHVMKCWEETAFLRCNVTAWYSAMRFNFPPPHTHTHPPPPPTPTPTPHPTPTPTPHPHPQHPLDKMAAISQTIFCKCIFLNENALISIENSLEIISNGPGYKPLSEPMLTKFADAYSDVYLSMRFVVNSYHWWDIQLIE